MPIQKLVIEYVNDKPLLAPDHFKMEQFKYHSAIAWVSLVQFLEMYSNEGIIIPIYPEGTLPPTKPKCKRTGAQGKRGQVVERSFEIYPKS